jgi:uncharacterized protein YkwD
MKKTALAAIVALCAGAAAPTSAIAGSCSTPAEAAALEAGMLDWINDQRRERGLKPYKRTTALDRSSENQACDMARHDYFAHSRPGGPKLGARMKQAGYRFRAGGENLAYTRQLAVGSAASLWRNSPPHWGNIVDPSMRDIGIAVVTDGERVLWVMNVGRPKG